MKILLLSYACEPGQGSEPGIGWHWAVGLAANHDVCVMTHPRGRAAIERALVAHPDPRLRFEFVELPTILDPWEREPGEKRIHLKYVLWQAAMYVAARKLVQREQFDLVHHVSWITITGPTLGWALGLPFVWGPVGSGQTAPLRMWRHLGTKGWLREAFRNVQVWTVGLNPLARLAARKSVAALASNIDTFVALKRLGAVNVRLLPDSAVDEHWVPDVFPERPARSRPVVAWLGRLEPRKAPGLAIEAFAKARLSQPCELWIIGQGSLLEPLKALAARLGVLEDERFRGRVPHSAVPTILLGADIFLFTSLRDTFPTVVLEAMALGLPVVSLDHQGLRALPEGPIFKVPVTDSRATADDLAAAITRLVQAPDERRRRGMEAWQSVRRDHLWTRRYAVMKEVYDAVLTQSSASKGHGADGLSC